MMTRLEKLVRELVLEPLVREVDAATLNHLEELGLIDRKACEELAIYRLVERERRAGAKSCEAMLWSAEQLCCSYEKVRTIYYKQLKSRPYL